MANHLVEAEREVGSVCTLHREVVDEDGFVLLNLGVARHQKINNNVDRRTAVFCIYLAHELKLFQLLALAVSVAHEGFDKSLVFAIAERFSIQTNIDIKCANMVHVFVLQQQPWNGTSDHGELAFEAAEHLPHLDENGLHCCGGPLVIVRCGLRFLLLYLFHFNFSALRCSAASLPRSPAMERSR
jgi:hypothetical protein